MSRTLAGLHHVTATVARARPDHDFYTRVLGLRLVKKTVNFDDPSVYHLYYGTARGMPGTLMTTFPDGGRGMRQGSIGAGHLVATAFSVPADSLAYWRKRFSDRGFEVTDEPLRFGEEVISVADPSGLRIELIGTPGDERPHWTGSDVDPEAAVRGLHSVTLLIRDPQATEDLMTGILGFEHVVTDGGRRRLRASRTHERGGGAESVPGALVDLDEAGDAPAGRGGIGTVHHVAFAIPTEEEQRRVREELMHAGRNVTDVRDRNYFRSIYFREPGGVLFEVATEGPGFLIDEEEGVLGRTLQLPKWAEPRREAIVASLPSIPD